MKHSSPGLLPTAMGHHSQFSHSCEENNQGKKAASSSSLNGSKDHRGKGREGVVCVQVSALSWTCASWQDEVIFLTLAKPDYFLKGMKNGEM